MPLKRQTNQVVARVAARMAQTTTDTDPARQAQILWKICNVLRSSPIWQQLEPAAQLLDQQAQQLAAQGGSEFSQLVDQSTIDAEPTPADLMWFGTR